MTTIAKGNVFQKFVEFSTTVTITPGSGGSVRFDCSSPVGTTRPEPQTIYAATEISIPGGSTLTAEAVGADATYTDGGEVASLQALVSGYGIFAVAQQLKAGLLRARMFDSATMSSPPTFTESADFASGSISGGVLVPLDDARIFKATPLSVAYATQGRNVFNPVSGLGSGLFFSFATDAATIEIDLQTGAAGIPIALIVDGQFAQSSLYTGTPPGSSGNIRRQWKFAFGSTKMRRIQVLNAGVYNGIAGVFIGPNDQIVSWNPGIRGGLLELADSYGGYPTAPVPHGGPGMELMDAVNYGASVAQVGGTGYYTTNGVNNYLTRLQTWMAAKGAPPGVLLTMGGINDDGVVANTKAAIDAFYAYCGANLTQTLHIVTGPWCPKQSYITGSDKYTLIRNWLLAALRANTSLSWIFLDTISGGWQTSWGTSATGSAPWITGSGYVGGTTGTGNADYYISSDQTHPSTAGVDYLRRRVGSDVMAALLSFT